MSRVVACPQYHVRPLFFFQRIQNVVKKVNYGFEWNIAAAKTTILTSSLSICWNFIFCSVHYTTTKHVLACYRRSFNVF